MASADILRADHSPLPWSLKLEGPRSRPQVVCPDPEDVEWPWVVAKCEGAAPNDATGENNAAFIVRACNAHYQMLEALQFVQRSAAWVGLSVPDKYLVCAAIAAAEAEAGR